MSDRRITPEALNAEIIDESFYVFPRTTVTVCALTLKNGYVVIGHSAAADPENFNEQVGQDIARTNAKNNIWHLLGFRLRDQLSGHEPGR